MNLNLFAAFAVFVGYLASLTIQCSLQRQRTPNDRETEQPSPPEPSGSIHPQGGLQ